MVAELSGVRVQVVGTLVVLQGDQQDDRFLYNRAQAIVMAKMLKTEAPALTNALLEAARRMSHAGALERDGELV